MLLNENGDDEDDDDDDDALKETETISFCHGAYSKRVVDLTFLDKD